MAILRHFSGMTGELDAQMLCIVTKLGRVLCFIHPGTLEFREL